MSSVNKDGPGYLEYLKRQFRLSPVSVPAVLRVAGYRGVDRYLRVGLTAIALAAVVGTGVGREDFAAGHWAMGFVFGTALHYWLPTRGRPSA